MVLMIIAVLSAGLVPRVAALREGSLERDFVQKLAQFPITAHTRAMTEKNRVVLSYDSQAHTLNLQGQADPTELDPKNNASQNATTTDPVNQKLPSLTFPSGVEGSSFMLAGKDVGQDNWKVTFYPDGTNDSASLDIKLSQGSRRLTLNPAGKFTLSNNTDEQPQERWAAGTYEPNQ